MRAIHNHSQSTQLEVISPYWAAFTEVRCHAGDARIEVAVTSWWLDPEDDLVVTLIPESKAQAHNRQRLVVGGECWHREVDERERCVRFSAALLFNGAVGPATLNLGYRDRRIQTVSVGVASGRLVVHEMFDPGYRILRERLATRTASDEFETGVVWLLHLCGLGAIHYGGKKLNRSTDAVAFVGSGLAVFGECTVEKPSLDKIAHVASRAEAFRTQIRDAHKRDVRLVKAIFMPVPRSTVTEDDRERAYEHGVVLVAAEDMAELLDMAKRGEDPLAAVGFIACCGNPTRPIPL